MSLSAAHKEQTRLSILASARRLFKERGYNGVGIDTIMADAGLTRGGFYAHFKSKQDLFSEAIYEDGLEGALKQLEEEGVTEPAEQFRCVIDYYLSDWHVDNPGQGCPLPTLTSAVAQSDETVRTSFTEMIQEGAKGFASLMPGGVKRNNKKALAVMATMVGGVMLARGVNDEKLAKEILTNCRDAIASLAEQKD